MKIAVIGAGVSGLSIAQCLKDKHSITVFEKESSPGGLIRCKEVNGSLYHIVGGHVFNSRRQDVLDWFWKFFDKDKEFIKALRNAIVIMPDRKLVGYPIENHVYMMEDKIIKSFISDLCTISKSMDCVVNNFEDFLKNRFGNTLYQLYFKPYNEKVWQKNLKEVPISWLEGKLPMPTVEEIIYNNFVHAKEMQMVHSSFYYAKHNGSQFLANRLAENLNIIYNSDIQIIQKCTDGWSIQGQLYDKVIFCSNIKQLPTLFADTVNISNFINPIEKLEYHGTTSVFCEIDKNPYSWIYMPSYEHSSHRIICTGNFSPNNNALGRMTATIEFTDYHSKEDIEMNLKKIPFSPQYLSHYYAKYTYPIQDASTRQMIDNLKSELEKDDFYLLGRFAEWEYYNMDAAIGAAIDLNDKI